MSDKVEIKITGTNQAGPAFRQVTSDAQTMGRSIDETGRRSAQSLQNINQRAAALGAAIGGATLLMGEFTRAAAEDEASQARVEQAIQNTGDALDDYSAKLDIAIKKGQEKAFSDDDTRDALTKLIGVTNDTGLAMDNLGLVMDFARARGISLATSADIIGKVMGGNLGILSRYGIVLGENATKEEALALIQQRSAGQAATYAETSLGQLDIYKDKLGELTEGWGAHAGAMQSVLLMLPGLRAGYIALAGAIGGLGGLGALAGIAVPAALVAGGASLAYGYNQDTIGETATNTFWNNFFLKGSQVMNALLPGDPYDVQKYREQLLENERGALINTGLLAPGEDQSVVWDRIAALTGTITGEMSTRELIDHVVRLSTGQGLTIPQWVSQTAGARADWIQDPITGVNMPRSEYSRYNSQRLIGSGMYPTTGVGLSAGYVGPLPRPDPYGGQGIYNPFQYDFAKYNAQVGSRFGTEPAYSAYGTGGTGAIANTLSGAGAAPIVLSQANQDIANAANAAAYTAALEEQYGAYARLIEGIDGARGAASAYKAVQDGLLGDQEVYNHQLGEFGGVQSDLTAGYEILLERQAAGQKLTKEEQSLLDNYPALYARISGAVDDATVSNALIAASYIENMKQSDAWKSSLDDTNGSLGSLNETLQLFILSLEGVPEEVRTRIYLDNISLALQDIETFKSLLDSVPPSVATTLYLTYQDYIPGGVGSPFLHGGIPRYANGGIPIYAGEAGPELMSFANGGSAMAMTPGIYTVPQNTHITPAPASRGRMSGGGGNIIVQGDLHLHMSDPNVYAAVRESAIGGSR